MSSKHVQQTNPYSRAQRPASAPAQQEARSPYAGGTRQRKQKGGGLTKGGKIALIAVAAVVLFVAAIFIGIGAFAAGQTTIYPNITVSGVDVGGLTVEQAAEKLDAAGYSAESGQAVTVKLTDSVSVSVTSPFSLTRVSW